MTHTLPAAAAVAGSGGRELYATARLGAPAVAAPAPGLLLPSVAALALAVSGMSSSSSQPK